VSAGATTVFTAPQRCTAEAQVGHRVDTGVATTNLVFGARADLELRITRRGIAQVVRSGFIGAGFIRDWRVRAEIVARRFING
jgi:hypothetical protein